MQNDITHAEFVGGPFDGETKLLNGKPDVVDCMSCRTYNEVPIFTRHAYKRRKADGVEFGLVRYDYVIHKQG